eukprot:1892767-Pyramimonas_sp.AAC.1
MGSRGEVRARWLEFAQDLSQRCVLVFCAGRVKCVRDRGLVPAAIFQQFASSAAASVTRNRAGENAYLISKDTGLIEMLQGLLLVLKHADVQVFVSMVSPRLQDANTRLLA